MFDLVEMRSNKIQVTLDQLVYYITVHGLDPMASQKDNAPEFYKGLDTGQTFLLMCLVEILYLLMVVKT